MSRKLAVGTARFLASALRRVLVDPPGTKS